MAESLRGVGVAATQAFLHKDYLESLMLLQRGFELLTEEPEDRLAIEQLLALRFTVLYTVYAQPRVRQRLLQMLQSRTSDARSTRVLVLLEKDPGALFVSLWVDTLYTYSRASRPATRDDSLELTQEEYRLVLSLPSSVLTAAILMALRMDAMADAQGRHAARSSCARQTCEQFFAAFLREGEALQDASAYKKVLRLYTVQVLGLHLNDWAYAHEFLEYSNITPRAMNRLAEELDAAHADYTARMDQQAEALRQAQQSYAEEVAKRAAPPPPPQDTPPNKDAPVPVPMASSAPKPRATVQRTPSVRRPRTEELPALQEKATSMAKPDGASSGPMSDVLEASDTPAPPVPSEPVPVDAELSHAAERQHLSQYITRRPAEEPSAAALRIPPSITAMLSKSVTRQRAARFLGVVVILLLARGIALLRKSSQRQRASFLPWLGQRFLDTLRMYVVLLTTGAPRSPICSRVGPTEIMQGSRRPAQ